MMTLKPRFTLSICTFLITLFLFAASASAFTVSYFMLNRWNSDGSNTRDYDITLNGFAGTLPDDIAQMDFEFVADTPPPPSCPLASWNDTTSIHSTYYGSGNFWFQSTSDTCFSYGGDTSGSSGVRDDGEYRLTVVTSTAETQDAPVPATFRLGTYRVLVSAPLVAPANNVTIPINAVNLSWDPAQNNTDATPLNNRVIVERTDTWQRVVGTWIGTATTFTVPYGLLEEGVEYRWHIRSYDGAGYYSSSNYARSDARYFTAGAYDASIPTLNEWGMIIMVLLLLGSAIWTVRRRQA